MSDYTPTTEHVRAVYGRRSDMSGIPLQDTGRLAEFDRWLAAHDAEVRAAALAEQGTEEPDWEFSWGGDDWVLDAWFDTEAEARDAAKRMSWMDEQRGKLVRRRKAGPWMPVEQGKP